MKFLESVRIAFAGTGQIHVAVFPDIDADRNAVRGRWDTRRDCVGAIIIETHAIDQLVSGNLPKKTGWFGAGLRVECHAANLHKPKPERRPQFQSERVLVVARSQSN